LRKIKLIFFRIFLPSFEKERRKIAPRNATLSQRRKKNVGRRAPAGKHGNIPSFSCGKSFDRDEKGYSG